MKVGRPEGRLATRYQVVILGRKNWTMPTASPGTSKVAGGFGTGGWDKPATSSGIGGGMGFVGGVVVCPRRTGRRKGRRGRMGGPIITRR